jgi:Domain of unknown function (DUF4349)
MFKKFSALLFMVAFILAACSPAASSAPYRSPAATAAASSPYDSTSGGVAPVQPGTTNKASGSESQGQGGGGEASSNVRATTVQRLVIKNAILALIVKDPAGMVNNLTSLAEGSGGFVVSSSVTQISVDAQGNKILSGQIALRVPADKLTEVLAQIKAQALSVKNENVTGEDVTAQYVDLQSQLTNLQAEVVQLQKIMDGATKTEDVLTVYQTLASVQGQIETIKGQMKYYTESAAMSLITVTLEQEWISQPIETGGWKPEGVLKSITEAWVATAQVAASLAMWGGIFCLPIILVVGFFIGLIVIVVRRLTRATRKAKTPPAA